MAAVRLLRIRPSRTHLRRCCSSSPSPSTDSEPHILTGRVGTVTTIALNRAASRNSVSAETARQLTAALAQFESDDSSPVAVLHGKGGNFCSGCDLAELAAAPEDAETAELPEAPLGPTGRLCAKPVVAAVDGYAVGGGLELALWCDLRVVEETAILGAYGRRFGVPLLDGGAARLPALIGLSRALDMILTGRAISGQEAFDWGLANRLVACGTALGQAVNLASSIAKFPVACVAADRRAAYHAAFAAGSLQEALASARDGGREPLESEGRYGAQRFMDGVGRHGKFNIHPEKQEQWTRR